LAVMSHGPLITPPEKVSTGLPFASSTIRHPAPTVAIVPSVVGRLPTITHPVRNTTNAVVSPTPPGQPPGRVPALISAKVVWLCALGAYCTIELPVPCRLPTGGEPALLKLLTRM